MSLDERLRRGLADAADLAEIDPECDHAAVLARARRRHRRQRLMLACCVVLVLAAGALASSRLGDGGSGDAIFAGEGRGGRTGGRDDEGIPSHAPPDLVVRSEQRTIELTPYTTAWSTAATGGARRHRRGRRGQVDSRGRLGVRGLLREVEELYPRALSALAGRSAAERRDDAPPAARSDPCGPYDVRLYGDGGLDGDLYVAFRWTTPTTAAPEPEARMVAVEKENAASPATASPST